MRQRAATPGLFLTMTLFALVLTAVPAGAGDVPYAPKQERVPDFGQFVPEHDVSDTLPYGVTLERVTTATPWGRGMAKVDGELIVLSRGRHRGEGGVDQTLVDSAGTLWKIDSSVCEPVIAGALAGDAVRHNATVFATPTSPPFHLYDYSAPPEEDVLMGRPYCALAYDEASRNLFLCAYSGAELSTGFRKHGTDAVYRYDLRDKQWHVVEQHDPNVIPREELGAVVSNEYYPHHDPHTNPPPHGWPNGADGCISIGRYLYVPAKDNHLIIQYNLDEIRRDPDAGPPNSRTVMDAHVIVSYPGGEQEMELMGPSGIAHYGGYLYIGYRTTSVVVRVPLDDDGDLKRDADGRLRAELIAVFEPWNPDTRRSGNLYDIDIDGQGDLFVSMGKEGKLWRITPDPEHPFYGNEQSQRPTTTPPFLDMTEKLGRNTGCNNIFIDDDEEYLYISSRNNDTGAGRIHGTIYRAKIPRVENDPTNAKSVQWNFDDAPLHCVPHGWATSETNPSEKLAKWQCARDETAPSGSRVLALTQSANSGGTFNLAVAEDGPALDDLELRVSVKAVTGAEDQGGGPIWRCIDADNYYVCRFNPLEENFRVYVVTNGRRRQLDSARVDVESGRWYDVRVVMRGDSMTCWLDGRELLHATDDSIAGAGRVGLWTKADAVTSFDELKVQPLRR